MSQKYTIQAEARFGPTFAPNILHDSPHLRVVIIALRAGQEIAAHTGDEGVFFVAAGRGRFYGDGGDVDIEAGAIVIVGAGERRGWFAEDDLTVLVARAAPEA